MHAAAAAAADAAATLTDAWDVHLERRRRRRRGGSRRVWRQPRRQLMRPSRLQRDRVCQGGNGREATPQPPPRWRRQEARESQGDASRFATDVQRICDDGAQKEKQNRSQDYMRLQRQGKTAHNKQRLSVLFSQQ